MLKAKWIVLAVLSAFWLIFTVFYSCNMPRATPSDIDALLKFIATSTAAFGVIFSSLLTSFNSIEASKINASKMDFDRTENSFAYMERWDSSTLKDARDTSRDMADKRASMSDNEFLNLVETDQNVRRSVIAMWNFFEEIYLSIEADRVNKQILQTAFSDIYCDIYERYKAWLHKKKKDTEQTKILDELYKLWRK